jgi:predicted dithiol-disulfide oxidoreductase (DUF899 family)
MSRTPVERLEDEARRRGWKLVWRNSTWNSFGWQVRSLNIFKGGEWVWGAACAYKASDDPNKIPSQNCASMILSELPGRGAEHGEMDDQRIFAPAEGRGR